MAIDLKADPRFKSRFLEAEIKTANASEKAYRLEFCHRHVSFLCKVICMLDEKSNELSNIACIVNTISMIRVKLREAMDAYRQ